jgi:hypothetical protein
MDNFTNKYYWLARPSEAGNQPGRAVCVRRSHVATQEQSCAALRDTQVDRSAVTPESAS